MMPAVKENGPICRILVPSMFDATRQTQKSIPMSMKDTLTVLFLFIILVFYEVDQALGLLKSGAKLRKIIEN